ncbi:MAG: alginate export family protein [Pseudomonadota bacterium]
MATGGLAAEPFRLQHALDLPETIRISGETRGRYESLDGQFRRGLQGSDQLLVFRSLVQVEADAGPLTFGIELQDSRSYLGDDGTPLSNSFVDPLDFLQVYVASDAPGLLGPGSTTRLKLGRQTLSIGSKRQIERVDFANVIKSYTGLYAVSENPSGDELHAFLTVLVGRFPTESDELEANVLAADREQWGRRVWGIHYRKANFMPGIAPDIWGEVFAYGLQEVDRGDVQTTNRNYVTPGFRVFSRPRRGSWDLDIEASMRFGSRRATSRPEDTDDLSVTATQILARVGYTFDAPWQPRIALQYYLASGDNNPDDDQFDQYERLFGGRRTDLNNTSIHGPLTPANLSAPGVRFDIKPGPRWDARLHYSAAFLASATDTFVIARLRDPTGASGTFMGHTLDARARYRLIPESLLLEIGASAFVFGEFTKTVPDGPAGTRTLFAYSQLTFSF